jgi:hypothetical protein
MWPKFLIKEVEKEYTDIELSEKLAAKLGNSDLMELPEAAHARIYKEMANIDGIQDLFRDTMVADLRRYFAATNDHDRDLVRGGFSRTAYLRAQVKRQLEN